MCWGTLFTSEQCLWGHFVGGHCTLWHRISARDTYNFSSYENWLACSWKQLLLLVLLLKRSTNKSHRVECLHSHDQVIDIEMEWAWLQCLNAWHNWVLQLTCDHILKFDWNFLAAEVIVWTHVSCQAIFLMTCAFLQVGVVVALVEEGRWVWLTWFGVEEGEEEHCCLWGASHMIQSSPWGVPWRFLHEEQEDQGERQISIC